MNQRIRAGFFWTLAVFFAASAHAQDLQQDTVLKANQLYLQQDYAKSAHLYEALIAEGVRNGYLYYNLGNAYSRLGKLGPAILNFIKAKELLPRDPSLDANLKYALRQTTDPVVPPAPGLLKTVFFWADSFTLKEHLHIVLAVNVLFWALLLGWFRYRSEAWDWARKTALIALLIVLCAAAVRIYQSPYADSGVVLAERIDVKSASGKENVTLFQLHEGAIITLSEEKNGWVRIALTPDKTGWVPRESIGT